MNLLNKIKLIFAGGQEDKDTAVRKIIKLEELPYKLESKINELTTLKKEFKERIFKRIAIFNIELNEIMASLEKIDISHRKEHDRIKFIVKENLDLYISHLKRTIENLKNIENEEVEEYLSRLFHVLNEFDRISSRPFEKATILIGDELSNTRAIVRLFIQDVNKIVECNNFIFEKDRLCNVLNNLLSESEKLTLLHVDIENKLLGIDKTLENVLEEQNVLKRELLDIRERDDFKRDNQDKVNYRNKLDSLEKEIQFVKSELNLKALLKRFHHDKAIDQLVRNYLTNFRNAIEEDKELRIIEVIDNPYKVISKLKEIQDTLFSLHLLSPTKVDKELAFLEDRIKEKEAYRVNLEISIKDEIRKKEKLSTKLQKINLDLMERSRLLF